MNYKVLNHLNIQTRGNDIGRNKKTWPETDTKNKHVNV